MTGGTSTGGTSTGGAPARALCRLEALPDGGARGFPPAPGGLAGLVAVRRGGAVHVYVNACPHLGIPLESLPDRFLDAARRHLVCTAHGARFRVEDGFCTAGPCAGDRLEAVAARVEDGVVLVPGGSGPQGPRPGPHPGLHAGTPRPRPAAMSS